MNEHRLPEMIDRYLAGKLTRDEQVELDQWYDSFENKRELLEENSSSMRKLAALKLAELKTKLFTVELEEAAQR
ncbi:MAG TPA: hypothetical protein VF476_00665 [Chitinophagaceae bacterium]